MFDSLNYRYSIFVIDSYQKYSCHPLNLVYLQLSRLPERVGLSSGNKELGTQMVCFGQSLLKVRIAPGLGIPRAVVTSTFRAIG